MKILQHAEPQLWSYHQPLFGFEFRSSREGRGIACFTPILRPSTDIPFFSSIARLASSSTALKMETINYKLGKAKSHMLILTKVREKNNTSQTKTAITNYDYGLIYQ